MIQLRPLISTGWQDSPTIPSINSGYISAHIKLCMQPSELPMTRRRWATLSPSVTSRWPHHDHVVMWPTLFSFCPAVSVGSSLDLGGGAAEGGAAARQTTKVPKSVGPADGSHLALFVR